jgi:hypothetical protein
VDGSGLRGSVAHLAHDAFYWRKSLMSPSAQADPRVLKDSLGRGLLSFPDLRKVKSGLDALLAVTHRLEASRNPAVRSLSRHARPIRNARLIRNKWDPAARRLLDAHLR